jgi:hypothetical protein
MAKKPVFVDSWHHARFCRYHEQAARAIGKMLKKSPNKRLQAEYDYHTARHIHHTEALAPKD